MEAARLLATTILLAFPAVVLCYHLPPGQVEIVDLTYAFDGSTIGWLNEKPFRMTVTQRGKTDILPWKQTEEIVLGTHVGTHIDAPCRKVRGGWTLEDIPLAYLVAPAAVVDISDRCSADADSLLLVSDLVQWEQLSGYSLNGTIVLVRTGWGSRWPNTEAYIGNADGDVTGLHYPGVSPEAAQWLVSSRRIYGVGIDTISLDSGVNAGLGEPAHQALLRANIFGLENVANLDRLPNNGFQLVVAPMRLGGGACGSPARILAIVP